MCTTRGKSRGWQRAREGGRERKKEEAPISTDASTDTVRWRPRLPDQAWHLSRRTAASVKLAGRGTHQLEHFGWKTATAAAASSSFQTSSSCQGMVLSLVILPKSCIVHVYSSPFRLSSYSPSPTPPFMHLNIHTPCKHTHRHMLTPNKDSSTFYLPVP